MDRISKNISYLEATHSYTAKRLGIDNTPSNEILENMRVVSEKVFQPLRLWVGGPIKINSFYRCNELNTLIGGTRNSAHTRGEAIDIDDIYGHKKNYEMFDYILNYLNFDKLIWEFGTTDNPAWIHVSYNTRNRGIVLRAYKDKKNKTKYLRI